MSVTAKAVATSKQGVVKKKTLTIKQQRLVALIGENLRKKGGIKAMGALLLEAGYAPSVAIKPSIITESETIKSAIQEFTDELDLKRRMALKHITDAKLKKTSAAALSQVVDTLTKNHQLLMGKATANIAHGVRRMTSAELVQIADGDHGDEN